MSPVADVLEAHGLRLSDPTARELVRRWRAATRALHGYLDAEALDLVDVSTLAEMFAEAVEGTESEAA